MEPPLEALHPSFEIHWETWYQEVSLLVAFCKTLFAELERIRAVIYRLGIHEDLCKLWSPSGNQENTVPLPLVYYSTPQVALGTPYSSREVGRLFLG